MASNGRRKGPSGGMSAASMAAPLPSSLAARSQSLPQLQAAPPPHNGVSFAAASNEYAAGGGSGSTATTKCRGEFCRVAPSALRGLYSGRLSGQANNKDPGEESDDNDNDNDEYDAATPRRRGMISRERDGVLEDDGHRFKIGNNNVLLAKAEMAFVTGSAGVKGTDSDDVALQWQEADNVHRMELGRTNPSAFYKQVSVCRNCHRIYADLATFRENGFQWHTKQKSAWTGSHDPAKDRSTVAAGGGGQAKKKKAMVSTSERHRASGSLHRKDTVSSPEDDASLHYGRLFLAELAKHSDNDALSHWQQQDDGSARSEHETDAGSRTGTLRGVADTLPALGSTGSVHSSSAIQKKKKPSPATAQIFKHEEYPGNQLTKALSHGSEAEMNALARLEQVIQHLREELVNEQAASKRVEAQRQLLEQKLNQHQTHMQEKEDEFRKKLLEADLESVSKKMHHASEPPSSSASDVGELIETIDSLNLQLHEANNATEKLRRDLLLSHQQELKRLHEKYQLEMESLRLSEYTAKEQTEAAHMQMTHWQNEAQVATSQAKNARAALDELSKTRLPQLEEKNQRLERQITELKAKSAASTISSVVNGPSQDVAAVEKHLNNKIDYLKAQLASEMKCKEELGSHLAGITASMEALKKEKRSALADQEEAHKRHLERVESNFAQEKEVMNTQQASLQGKIATLQANVTDLVQDLTMWKSREANSKLALDKMAEENVRLTRQIVDLEGQVEMLQDERKRDGNMGVKNASDETQRVQMEALLRRLDNERQYLKNQVDNEVEQKLQCQQKAHDLEEELREVKVTTEEITKIAEHKISALTNEKAQLERLLRDEKGTLEESKLMLTRQLKDMQVKILQNREQALLDKDELEKSRIELSEARSQLIAAREESVKEKEYGKSANERMSKALATIKSSLKAMEQEKNLRIERLEEENNIHMQKLARSQGDLLVLENKWSEDKQAIRRQQALTRLLSVINLRLENRHIAARARAFRQLQSLSTTTGLRNSLITAHNHDLAERENELRQDFMDKCDELTQSLHAEREVTLKQAHELREREKEELQQFYEQEKSQLEEDLQHLHVRQMRELEEQYEQTLRSVDEQSAAALGALQGRCDEVEQERNEARAAVIEMRTRCELIGATVETKQQIAMTELREKERAWAMEKESIAEDHTRQLRDLESSAESQIRELREVHEKALADALDEAEERHMGDLQNLRSELKRESSETVRMMQSQHLQEIQNLKDSHATELEELKQQIIERLQQEFELERVKHEEALKTALERVETKTQAHLESLQKDMNDRKANALLQCTAKWQKAMEDLQARLEIEKKVAYESGLQDRENEWQQAALQIKQKQKDELDSVQNEAVRAIQAAGERHRMLLQSQTALLRKEFEEKHKLEVEALRMEIIATERAKSQRDLEAALKEQEAALVSHFDQNLRNLRDELTDDHSTDLQSLKEKSIEERDALDQKHQQERQVLKKELEDKWTHKLDELCQQKDAELSSRMMEYEHLHRQQLGKVRLEMDEAFGIELGLKLKEQEERLLNEQEEAINQVQEDSEKLIEQVEVAMGELKKQKEALENELMRLRSALEEAEDAHFDVEENLKKQQKSMVFQLIVLIMHAKKTLEDARKTHTERMMELQAKHDQLDMTAHRDKRQWERDMVQIRETWTQLQARHSDMLQTLTNYKRDELVAHRSASAVLSNEVSIVAKQMDEVTEMKAVLEKEIEQFQAEAHGVEASLRQLMLQHSSSSSNLSGASDGSLNMAVVAKKRRLNEEFDALLEQVERKKSEVRNMDKTLASLRQRREEKEGELKAMERKLVEILVGQQKQMLVQLNATREVALPAAIATIAAS